MDIVQQFIDNVLELYCRYMRGEEITEHEKHILYHLVYYYPSFARIPLEQRIELVRNVSYKDIPPWREAFGMTSGSEQAYIEWHASHLYTGGGDWVELGSFLGSLTRPAVRGFEANPNPRVADRKVRVYDLFEWDFVMTACTKDTPFADCFEEGKSYLPVYKAFIDDAIDRTEIHQADLNTYEYTGEPIEFLNVDVMKYERLVDNVQKQFFPHLIPGKAHLFHQDYLHFYEAWVTLGMFNMRDSFKFLGAVTGGGAVVFRCIGEVRPESLGMPLDSKEIPAAWIEDAFAWSYSIIPEDSHDLVAAANVMMFIHAGRPEEARRCYRDASARYADSTALSDACTYIRSDCGVDLEA